MGAKNLKGGHAGREGAVWQARLRQLLPEYGHRNWIVVADAAYPRQSAPGIATVCTGQDQIVVLKCVLQAIAKAPHVRAVVMLDAELDCVAEKDAPGAGDYRDKLRTLLKGQPVKVLPHRDIIDKLDQGARLFNVLLLKTELMIPYTSVFLELDCGYWDDAKEARLRRAFDEKAKAALQKRRMNKQDEQTVSYFDNRHSVATKVLNLDP